MPSAPVRTLRTTAALSGPAALTLALTLALALAGCMGAPAGGGGAPPLLPTARYVLQAEPDLDRIALAVRHGDLSPTQEAALAQLASRFRVEGAPVLTIEAPSGEDPVALATAHEVRRALERGGVPGGMIRTIAYSAPDGRAPVLAGFDTYRAVVPQCGVQWDNLTRTASNRTSSNFGCAVTANLAAQIANPRDIVQPRGMTPADAGRRAVVFATYQAGEATSAEREELLTNQRVSRAVE